MDLAIYNYSSHLESGFVGHRSQVLKNVVQTCTCLKINLLGKRKINFMVIPCLKSHCKFTYSGSGRREERCLSSHVVLG